MEEAAGGGGDNVQACNRCVRAMHRPNFLTSFHNSGGGQGASPQRQRAPGTLINTRPQRAQFPTSKHMQYYTQGHHRPYRPAVAVDGDARTLTVSEDLEAFQAGLSSTVCTEWFCQQQGHSFTLPKTPPVVCYVSLPL